MTDRTALSGVTPATVRLPSKSCPPPQAVWPVRPEVIAFASRLGHRTGGRVSLRREAVQDVRSVRQPHRLLVLGQHLSDDGVGDLFGPSG